MLLFAATVETRAQAEWGRWGAEQAAMGSAAVAQPGLWALGHNPAGLAQLERPAVGLFAENRFLLPELSTGTLAGALPTRSGVFGLSFSQFGYSLYSQSRLGLAFAKQLGQGLGAAVQLNYFRLRLSEEPGLNAVVADLGLRYQVFERLALATHLFNPSQSGYLDPNRAEDLPTYLRAGLWWTPDEKTQIGAQFEKDLRLPPSFSAGLSYQLVDGLWLRGGFSSQPAALSFGLGYQAGLLRVGLAFSMHQVLGYTPHADFMAQL